ncbi:cadherin-like protein 26 [Menidia menidia]
MEMKLLCVLTVLCWGVQSSDILLRQKRAWVIQTLTIPESYGGPFPHTLGKIEVEKGLHHFKIKGQGVDEEPKNLLRIDENTREVFLLGPVDHEQYQTLTVILQAQNIERNQTALSIAIQVIIEDANDNPPRFDSEKYEITVTESTLQGSVLTTVKATDIDSGEKNKDFSLRIVGVSPKPQDLEFNIMQRSETGAISFKGCLDHEKAEKYTIIVEAKDHGEPQLSSSCTVIISIEDGNNHLPVITGQKGPGRVKEGQKDVLVSRLQVTDADVKGSLAWKAKFLIHGDTDNNFRITTDQLTNEGLLYVEKQLDYEEVPVKNITVTVENEIAFQKCKVLVRTITGLWKTQIIKSVTDATAIGSVSGTEQRIKLFSYDVTVTVVDVNEHPVFDEDQKSVSLAENAAPGQHLETFKARDFDRSDTVIYTKGKDPADWVTVDSKTGRVTLSKSPDRESSFVKDGLYVVTVNAIDNGKPPQTGTATLSITIRDENDNAPSLLERKIDMCVSEEASKAQITASDLDEEPYAGPFRFGLLGDVADKWRIDPELGHTVNLVKENNVYSGSYELQLELSDLQGKKAVHNLLVTVCSCTDQTKPNCVLQKATAHSTLALGAIGIMFICMVPALLCLACKISCHDHMLPLEDGTCDSQLITDNMETPGTDCKVPIKQVSMGKTKGQGAIAPAGTTFGGISTSTVSHGYSQKEAYFQKRAQWNQFEMDIMQKISDEALIGMAAGQHTSTQAASTFGGISASTWGSSQKQAYIHNRTQMERYEMIKTTSFAMKMKNQQEYLQHRHALEQEHLYHYTALSSAVTTALDTLSAPGNELGDYEPHVYTEEGDSTHSFELDAISNPEMSFDLDMDFDVSFSTLASICVPDMVGVFDRRAEDGSFEQQSAVTYTHFSYSGARTHKVSRYTQQDCLC